MILPGFPRPLAFGNTITTFVASAVNAIGGANITVDKPTGTLDGDLLIAVVVGPAGATLTGWTSQLAGANIPRINVLTKVASGEPSTFTFSTSSAAKSVAVLAYRGGASAVDVVGTIAASETASAITATSVGVLLGIFAINAPSAITTLPSGMTQRAYTGSVAGQPTTAVCDLSPSPAGNTGTKNLNWAASSSFNSVLIQIK